MSSNLRGATLILVRCKAGSHEAIVGPGQVSDRAARFEFLKAIDWEYDIDVLYKRAFIEIDGSVGHNEIGCRFSTIDNSVACVRKVKNLMISIMDASRSDKGKAHL